MRTAHDTLHLDFAALETYDGCATPGGGAAFITGGGTADFRGCSFRRTSATNGNGGAIFAHSEFSLDPNATTALAVRQSRFEDTSADYYGASLYSSLSDVVVEDSTMLLGGEVEIDREGEFFAFGGTVGCASGCGAGTYGVCEAVGACVSCEIGACAPCPAGTYRAAEGAVDESECLPCPRGTVSATEGATQCDVSPPGSYTTDDPSDVDGSGITIGASASVPCPAGRIAATKGSSSCEACPVGKTSVEGGTEVSQRVLFKLWVTLTLTLPLILTLTLTLTLHILPPLPLPLPLTRDQLRVTWLPTTDQSCDHDFNIILTLPSFPTAHRSVPTAPPARSAISLAPPRAANAPTANTRWPRAPQHAHHAM